MPSLTYTTLMIYYNNCTNYGADLSNNIHSYQIKMMINNSAHENSLLIAHTSLPQVHSLTTAECTNTFQSFSLIIRTTLVAHNTFHLRRSLSNTHTHPSSAISRSRVTSAQSCGVRIARAFSIFTKIFRDYRQLTLSRPCKKTDHPISKLWVSRTVSIYFSRISRLDLQFLLCKKCERLKSETNTHTLRIVSMIMDVDGWSILFILADHMERISHPKLISCHKTPVQSYIKILPAGLLTVLRHHSCVRVCMRDYISPEIITYVIRGPRRV